jgi:hypothetical protein
MEMFSNKKHWIISYRFSLVEANPDKYGARLQMEAFTWPNLQPPYL